MRSIIWFPWFSLCLATTIHANEWQVRGRVVDATGQPVAEAVVDSFWTGNGTRLREDGTRLDPKKKEDLHPFWEHLGEMEPYGGVPFGTEQTGKTDAAGFFTLRIDDGCHTVIAMDRARKRGAVATLPNGKEEQPIEIRLGPLIRVRGAFKCAETGKPPFWNHVMLLAPSDPTRPLDFTGIASCGSFDGRFAVVLPPGRYVLDAYGDSIERAKDDVRLIHAPGLILTADKAELDIGTLVLVSQLMPRARVEKAKASGASFDYQKHYGEPPPPWHISDARGVNKDVQITDFKGKWVILDFWGMSCIPCLRTSLPNLMKFYEDHKAQRDQFEIVTICIDYDGDLKTIAELDRALEPIVKNVWGGRTLPFPVLLDPSFKTWETFGIDGLGTMILIDPDGKLVEGDETTLAAKLK